MNKKIKNISGSKVLLKNGQILNVLNGKDTVKDILIEDGKIVKIGKIENNDSYFIIDCNNKIITQAFVDIHTHFKSPGVGDQETFISGSNAIHFSKYFFLIAAIQVGPILAPTSTTIEFLIGSSE